MESISQYCVHVPVTNLRREPSFHEGFYIKDPLQESQLLFGEKLIEKKQWGEWVFVEAIDQSKFHKWGWEGYYGWVLRKDLAPIEEIFQKENLTVCSPWCKIFSEPSVYSSVEAEVSFGARLVGTHKQGEWHIVSLPNKRVGAIHEDFVREFANIKPDGLAIYEEAKKFLGFPYLWGGLSYYCPDYTECISSVDCSGLVHLIYRSFGVTIPRDAHDQFLMARGCEYKDLKVGDLIFLSEPEKSPRISHVMLFGGNDLLLESTMDGNCVQEIQAEKKLSKKLSSISNGETVNRYQIFFGAIL